MNEHYETVRKQGGLADRYLAQRLAAVGDGGGRSRLLALANAHDVLTQQNWQRAPLRNIVNRALTPLDISRLAIIGPYVPIDASKSYYCGARACNQRGQPSAVYCQRAPATSG